MLKKKLLIILGAGSSIRYGMPSVDDIDNLMKPWSQEQKIEPPRVHDVFNTLWKVVKKYYDGNHYKIGPNYEKIIGEMTALASWLSPPPSETRLLKR